MPWALYEHNVTELCYWQIMCKQLHFKLCITLFVSVTSSLLFLYSSILDILKCISENTFHLKTRVCCEIMTKKYPQHMGGDFKPVFLQHFFRAAFLQRSTDIIAQNSALDSVIWRHFHVSDDSSCLVPNCFLCEEFLPQL